MKQRLKRNTTVVASSKRGNFCLHSLREPLSSWQRSAQSQFVSPRCKRFLAIGPESRSQAAWAVGNKGVGHKQPPEGQLLGAGCQQKHLSPAGSWAGEEREGRAVDGLGCPAACQGFLLPGNPTCWWPCIDVGRNYCHVRVLHGCHMCNKQVASVVTCSIDFCSTGKSITVDNTPMGLLVFGHVYLKCLFP